MSKRPAPARAPSRTADRHRRQFEERDARIREVAQRLLLERGLHGFSMDDVAEAIEYSKGTVYLHYTNKEDALVASCADACSQVATWLERAAAFPGRPRERMVAVAEAYGSFVREKPVTFRTIPIIQSPTVLEKAAPARLRAVGAAQARSLAACGGIVRDAITCKDLTLSPGVKPEDVTFGLWALMFGSYMLAELHAGPDGILGVIDPAAAVRLHWALHMDGLGWKPTLQEWDYRATVERVRQALFPDAPREKAPTRRR